MSELENKVNQLKSLIDAQNLDTAKITNLLKELKEQMIHTSFLTNEENKISEKDRLAYRTVLECDAILHIKTKNVKQFALDIQKLKTVYFREESALPKSDKMPLLLSTYLVYLLTQGQIVEFNIEIPNFRKLVGKNQFLDYSTELLHAVVDNSFTQLFNLNAKVPSPLFQNFTSLILDGARHSHADSLERSYKRLKLDELVQILHFENADQAKQFIDQRGWTLTKNNFIKFTHTEEKEKIADDEAARYVDLAIRLSGMP
ncbi:hypothetical protein M9Y10_011430 [Tritrichomonas musculus]|uniref:PCI domain-containing protein n=1 Tax=Tritrichomonas musculus TaxID=1915356 RepID=A0ABR2IJB5_9EUKA